MDHQLKRPVRFGRLQAASHRVRQAAIERNDDLDGWQVSRLLRDVQTSAEADEAERRLLAWEARAWPPSTLTMDSMKALTRDLEGSSVNHPPSGCASIERTRTRRACS